MACSTQPPPPLVIRLQVPPELLACRDQPAPGVMTNDASLAYYVQDLAMAGADCREKLERVKEVVTAP
jgi:hypothetical protein